MTYYDTLDKNKYAELASYFEYFNPDRLDTTQIEHSETVTDDILSSYSKRTFINECNISLASLISGTEKLFENIGLHRVANLTKSILSITRIDLETDNTDFDFSVISDIAFDGKFYYKVPDKIIVPKCCVLSSKHFLAHEVSHILKELNAFECESVYTLEEVLPIAIELITAYENKCFEVFKKRELLLVETIDMYLKLSRDKKYISNEDIFGFMSCYRKCIMYLNSFYYQS